ncbi:ABC transporter permease [Staphylococcus hominis]|uniref:ABC transporter permease n=1 Tax=Staphylococcus hominis TaxID=1290 RepID=UPI001F59E761|nr:ABC transporter permease [Staphylococcus hominis]MCI2902499.1 ABC transporter permease [Staphylococcus hominis]
MIQLIKNELFKLKSERFILVIVLLNLIPLLMNLANFVVNDSSLSLDNGFYFRFYNQYIMLIPIITSVLSASIFYIEYKNQTFLNWISYYNKRQKLFLSKLLTSYLISTLLALLNLLAILLFYIINDFSISNIFKIIFSFLVLNFFTILIMTVVSTFLINLTQNIIITIVCGIGVSLVTIIFMAAPFSYIFPTSLGYRLGLKFIDPTFYYNSPVTHTIIGFIITLVIFIIFYILSFKTMKVK